EAHDNARHSAIADNEVGAEAKRHHRHVRVQVAQELRQVVLVRRLEQPFGIAATLEPNERREGCVRSQSAADLWHGRNAHLLCLDWRIPSGSAAAHLVMSPAPMQMIMSPSAAKSRSSRHSSFCPEISRTIR